MTNTARTYGFRPVTDPTGDFKRREYLIEASETEIRIGDPVYRTDTGMIARCTPGHAVQGAVVSIENYNGTPVKYYPGKSRTGYKAIVACDPWQEFQLIANPDGAVIPDPTSRGRYAAFVYGDTPAIWEESAAMIDPASVTTDPAVMDVRIVAPLNAPNNYPNEAGAIWTVTFANHQDFPPVTASSGGTTTTDADRLGEWSVTSSYPVGSLVSYNGTIYRAKISNSGNAPTNTTYWEQAYEPLISPKNTAFNKNFGTGANEVARGNHTHNLADLAERSFNSLTDVPTILSADLVTTIGSPGLDTNIVSERAIRTALDGKANSDILDYIEDSDIPDTIARDAEVTAALAGKVNANPAITPGTYTKVIVDSKGLVTYGSALADTDIPDTIARDDEVAALLANKVDANAAITAGTYTKVIVDSKGLVTNGGTLVEADIPAEIARAANYWTKTELAATGGDGTKIDWSQLANVPTLAGSTWLDPVADMTALAAIDTSGFTGGECVLVQDEGDGTAAQFTYSGGSWVKIGDVDWDPMTDAQIKTAYENNADTNAFTDALKAKLEAITTATTEVSGLVELATTAEAQNGTDTTRSVTPSGLKATLDGRTATTVSTGLVELATTSEASTGTDATRAVTPLGLTQALSDKAMLMATYDPLGIGQDVFDADYQAFDPGSSGLSSTNVQAAIVEVAGLIPASPVSATTTAQGVVELSTNDESIAGTDTTRAVTPASLTATLNSKAMLKTVYDPGSVGQDVYDADYHAFTPGSSGLTSTDVQSAIVEVAGLIPEPGGVSGSVQFNDGGAFGGFWSYSSGNLDAGGDTVKGLHSAVVALSTGTSATMDVSSGNHFTFTPTGNYTVSFSNAPASGKSAVVTLELTSGGAFTPTFTGVNWGLPGVPDLSGSGEKDILTFLWTGSQWVGSIFARGL